MSRPAEQADLFAPATDPLQAEPDAVLLDDLADAATVLGRLGGTAGMGTHTVAALRAQVAAASRELLRRWAGDKLTT